MTYPITIVDNFFEDPDEVVEIVPFYNNQGRQFSVALNYKW